MFLALYTLHWLGYLLMLFQQHKLRVYGIKLKRSLSSTYYPGIHLDGRGSERTETSVTLCCSLINVWTRYIANTGHCHNTRLLSFSSGYSGTSIYHSHNACTVRHFWSRMKFHINNVIYSHIHRSPNYRFTAMIICKSWSWRSISRMDRLGGKNFFLKWSIYYLCYLLFGL
jgi:hypothetical protein